MESIPYPDAVRSYLTGLHDIATQEIDARKPVELESQDTPEVIPPLIDVTALHSPTSPNLTPEPPNDPASHRIFVSLAEAFAHHSGRLVLLGRPGAGKTTALWMFAREQVDSCLADPTQPLPIFLKIDTWNRKTPIADWILSQMPGLPLQNIPLLYLCDGLDELGGERPVDPDKPKGERFDPRADFLRLAEVQLLGSQFVISCRIAEYEQIRSKMHGCGAVTLLPLGEEKIEEFLISWDRPRLWEALQNDPNLMEIARTPLLLSLLCSAIGADTINAEQDLHHLNETALFGFYFERRFVHEERKFQAQNPNEPLPFDKVTTQQLLGKLALYMWHWPYDPLTTLDRIEARFHLGERAEAFLAFARRMHFLHQSPSGHIAFIHLKFRDFCVVPALQQMLEDRSAEVRKATFGILFYLKEQGVPMLLQAAEQNTSRVRREACSHLADLSIQIDPALRIALAQGIPTFQRLLQGSDEEVHMSILETLVRMGAPALPVILRALQGEDTAMRYTAASVLAHVSPRVAPELHDALALAIPILMEALKSNNHRKGMRSKAVSALVHLSEHTDPFYFDDRPDFHHYWRMPTEGEGFKDRQETSPSDSQPTNPTDPWLCEMLTQTVPALVAALKESDYREHEQITVALRHQEERALPGLLAALQESDPNIRSAVLSFLSKSSLRTDPAVQEAFLQSVPALLQDLDSKVAQVRRTAVAILLEFHRSITQTEPAFREVLQQAVPRLLNVLYERDKEALSAAAFLLSQLDVSIVPVLLQELESGEAGVRRKAAAILAQLATNSSAHKVELKQSMLTLLHALQDTDAGVRNSVISILTQLSHPACEEEYAALTQGVPALLEAIRHRDKRVRRAAVLLLTQSGEQPDPALREVRDEVVPILLEMLQQRDGILRSQAQSAIHRLATQTDLAFQEAFIEAIPAFLRKIKRKREWWDGVKHDSGVALAAFGPSIVPVLIQTLQEEDFRLRQLSVMILEQLPKQSDRPLEAPALSVFAALLQALNDPEPHVRAMVVSALSSFGAEAIPPLIHALQDRHVRVQREAMSSLAHLRTAAVPALLQALHAEEVAVRQGAASTLLRIGIHKSERDSASGMRHYNPALREIFTQAVPALQQALQDPDAEVREEILSLLCLVEEQVEPLLLEMLEDEALRVRRCAVDSLTYRRATIPALLRLLQSDRHVTRWTAVAALSEHGYVPRPAFRPRLHIVLRHRLGIKSSAARRWLLTLLAEASFLQRLPIQLSEAEA